MARRYRRFFRRRRPFRRRRGYVRRSAAQIARSTAYVTNFTRLPTQVALPNKFTTRLRYSESMVSIDPSLGGLAGVYTFVTNDLNDPNDTSLGHRPMGYSQLAQMYQNWIVIGFKINVVFSNTDITNSGFVGIQFATTPTPIALSDTDIRESGLTVYRHLAHTSSQPNQQSRCRLSQKCAPHRLLGIGDPMSNDGYVGGANPNASPNTLHYCHLLAWPQTAVDMAIVHANVDVEYICVFFNPIAFASSA